MTNPQDELAYLSASDVAARIRRRELSPVEVVDACIERIEARNPSLNAMVFLGFEDARRSAIAAEAALAGDAPLGPLHGVPTVLKDLFGFRPGWVSTFGGIRALKDHRPDLEGIYAERMQRAGAILVGKTNSPVMGFRGTCDNPLFGPTRNPFHPGRNSGGSSGGSAAAVADGMVAMAEGTDAGGSIRVPAAWCGVYGFQPSFGRVPIIGRPDGFGGTSPFRYCGPITRTVADAALAMTALGGYDPRDPFSLRDRVDYRAAVDRGIAGMRVAYSRDLGVFPVDRRVAEVVERAVRGLEDAGAHVEEVSLGLRRDQRELSDLWCRLIMPGNHDAFARLRARGIDVPGEHRDDLPPEYLHWLDATAGATVGDLADDHRIRTEVFDAMQEVFAGHDLLVCPTVAGLPVVNADDGNTLGPSEIGGVPVDPLIGWCMTYFTNFTGHPAASVPAGLADGLPVGMQLVGPRCGDAEVLAASGAFEQVRPWAEGYQRCAHRELGPTAAG